MKFLLAAVNAKYIHSNLAVYSLKAYAEKYGSGREAGCAIGIGEYTINQSPDEILRELYMARPDVVGFSCYIWNIDCVRQLTALIGQVMPEVPVWLGGPEVSWEAEEQLASMPEIAGIMIGEGEETFLELTEHYLGTGKELSRIRGLVYREGGRILRTGSRPALELSRVPFPYEDLAAFDRRLLYYESSRGCPFSCSYCLSSVDKKLRFRDLELVYRELGLFLDRGVRQVKFIDRTFNCKKSHAMAIWNYLAGHDNGITNFHFEISADLLDDEMTAVLSRMRPGLVQLEIGIQSTCPQTIEAIHRRTDLEQAGRMIRQVHAFRNIHQHLDLIAGLPMEDYERFGQSFDDVYRLHPDQLQLGFLKVLKGTVMKEEAEQYGLLYHRRPPYEVLATRWLPYEKLLRLKRVEQLVETYYNSGQFTMTLQALEHRYDSPFHMYEEMGDFFDEKGFFAVSPSREERYQRLEAFLSVRFPSFQEADRQLLTWDCYLRENAKKRPAFALDQQFWSKAVSDFFAEENRQNRYFPHYAGLSYRQLLRQVHMEVFTFDIPTLAAEGILQKQTLYVCFDYGKRGKLDYNSQTRILPADLFS